MGLREEIAQAKRIIELTPDLGTILKEANVGSYNPCFLEYSNILEAVLDAAAELQIVLVPVRGGQTFHRFEIGEKVLMEVGYNLNELDLSGILIYDRGVNIYISIYNDSVGIKRRVIKALTIATM